MNAQPKAKSSKSSEEAWAPTMGDLLVLVGAIVLLVSLFLNWWTGPADAISVSAWTALEIADLVLAALAIIAIVLVFPAPPGTEDFNRAGSAWLPWLGPIAIVIIGASLLDDPPAVNGLSIAVGAWIGLGGAIVLAVGGLLRRVGFSVTIAPRG